MSATAFLLNREGISPDYEDAPWLLWNASMSILIVSVWCCVDYEKRTMLYLLKTCAKNEANCFDFA